MIESSSCSYSNRSSSSNSNSNSNSNSSSNSSGPLQLTEGDVERIKNDFLWVDNIELRKKMVQYFDENLETKFPPTMYLDCPLNQARIIAHNQTNEIISQKFITGKMLRDDPMKIFAFLETLLISPSVATKLSVHYGLYGACLAHLGTSFHHEEFLDKMEQENHIGAFLMSELTHASNVRALGTTATYDKSSDSFIINTPHTGAQKYYIGNGVYSAINGIIFAQLIVNGENKGIHPLIVPLRPAPGAPVFKGIKVKDVGQKFGLNGVDNARFWFDHYKVPRSYLLNKYANVDANGVYSTIIKNPNLLFAKHIGALLQARIGVGSCSISVAKASITIAIRYAFRRKQFGPDPNNELPIISYRMHQRRLIPRLANVFALNFFQNNVKLKYTEAMTSNKPLEEASLLLKQVHMLSCVSKVVGSFTSLDIAQMAREACGGQGYLVRNILPILRADTDIAVTLDGDNYLLMQQISQVLLSQYAKRFKKEKRSKSSGVLSFVDPIQQAISATKIFYNVSVERIDDLTRSGLLIHYWNSNASHLQSKEFLLGALKFRKDRLLHTLALRAHSIIQQEKKQYPSKPMNIVSFEVYNQTQDHSYALAQAYCDYVIAKQFFATIGDMRAKYSEEHNIVRVMKHILQLYVLEKIEKDPFFVAEKIISSSKLKTIRDTINNLCLKLVPVCNHLVNSFGAAEAYFRNSIASLTQDYVELNEYEKEFAL
jgi:acyl-CoA oxidase